MEIVDSRSISTVVARVRKLPVVVVVLDSAVAYKFIVTALASLNTAAVDKSDTCQE